MNDQEDLQRQLNRLERKVDTLQWLVGCQSVCLLGAVIVWVISLFPKILYLAAVAVIVLAIMNPSVASWLRWWGRRAMLLVRGTADSTPMP